MEDILAKILKDSSPGKHALIRKLCLETQEFLESQHGLMRSPPFEVRNQCLTTLQLVLESKHSKLVSHALNGFQRLIWDKSFQSAFESDDEENWLPCQLLKAVCSLPTHQEDVQVEILKILLQMTGSEGHCLSTRSVIQLISLCLEVYSTGPAAVRTAAQATANQSLQTFCSSLQEVENEEGFHGEEYNKEIDDTVEAVIEDMAPVLTFLCEKLKGFISPQGKLVTPLLLQCILSILTNLKNEVHLSNTFLNFVWQQLCPQLVAMLGSPKTDKNIVSSQKSSSDGSEVGRGSGCLTVAPSCQSSEAKTIYSIAVELVRLVGSVGSLRPVLESLFHRMLLYPPAQHRLDALKALKDLMKKPQYLLNFAAPPLYLTNDKSSRSADVDLIRIAMDSFGECCHSSDSSVCYASVSCVVVLLKSLETVCSGAGVSEAYVTLLNEQFKTLESSDYLGVKPERWLETRLRCQNSPVLQRKKYPKKTFVKNISDMADSNSNTCLALFPDSSSDSDESDSECDQNGDKVAEDQEDTSYSEKVGESVNNDLPINSPCEDKNRMPISENDGIDVETSTEVVLGDAGELAGNKDESVSEDVPCGTEENCNGQDIDKDIHVNENELMEQTISEVIPNSASSATTDRLSEAGGDDEILDALVEHERELAEREADRRKKVPRTLLGQEDAGKKERERVERLCEARLEFAQQERQNARQFVKELLLFLPKLLAIRSSIEADQALQEFASSYCEGMWRSQQDTNINDKNSSVDDTLSHITIMNADGIYLAMYSALLLNLKLIRNRYYNDPFQPVPLTEHHFIEEVHGSGVLVYLSATWLAELYQQVLASNLLEAAGYCPGSLENSAIINLLTGLEHGVDGTWVVTVSDVDGLGNSLPGGQQLADYRRLERAVANVQSPPNVEAGMKFARRILTSSWETILEVLSVLLNGTNSCGISSTLGFLLGTEGAKEEHRKAKDAIAESLDGLQMAAKLCNALGLQARSSAVFAHLAAASCPLSDDNYLGQAASPKLEHRQLLRKSLLPSRSKSLRLHTSQILSMEAILKRGLELGSHSSDCWKYVFQCCMYVLDLERTYFSDHSSTSTVLTRPPILASNSLDKRETGEDDLLFTSLFDATKSSFMDTLPMPGKSLAQKLSINELIKQNGTVTNSTGIVKDRQLLEIIEVLSQLVDRLFEEAASRLNLCALIGFLVELCAASQIQLFNKSLNRFLSSDCHGNSLLLYHLGDIMLRCARGGRPLIHVMKSWSVVAPHFVEAACHKDRVISKKAITIIHDIVSALLSSNSELPHFHFNEALFKPFENLLCLELCDADVQEQIISSICEFVEGCTVDIRSGWRPLFGALRAVRISGFSSCVPTLEFEREQSHHLRVVLDVFEAFLGTNNILVFAYAVVDCLLCLLKHVRGPEIQDSFEEQSVESLEKPFVPIDMCLAALKYLERCAAILSSMYSMPSCPIFNSANRIQIHSEPNLVDPNIPGMEIIDFSEQSSHLNVEYRNNRQNCDGVKSYSLSYKQLTSLKSLDKSTGVLHVWFLLLEGLAGAMATCPKRYQPHTMESLFCMLRNIKDVPGPSFGVFCVNHLLLPMLQNWLRRTTNVQAWDNFAANFKQCCGFATDLVVDYIQCMSEMIKEESHQTDDVKLMLQQLFVVLTECIAQSTETISRLGCACIKHAVMTAGKFFTCDLWDIVCSNIQRACRVTLHNVRQLIVCFHPDSDNFYGDLGEVQVAARRDCTLQESERLRQLAHQVFLLDCQRHIYPAKSDSSSQEEERSFIFLLRPPDQENSDNSDIGTVRIPFRSLVEGLLSHQILLQTIGTILLEGTNHLLPSLMALLPSLTMGNANSSHSQNSAPQLPGFLSVLRPDQMKVLLSCLEESYKVAYEFDCRPGLKFLIEKVAETDVAANLYKQAAISWTTHMLVLFEICLQAGVSSEFNVKSQVSQKRNALVSTCSCCSCECNESSETEMCSAEKVLGDNCNSKFSENMVAMNYSFDLQEKFRDLCETYIGLILDRDGTLAIVDKITDQPIFFLIASPEETNDFSFSSRNKEMPPVPDSKDDVQDDIIKEYHSDDSNSEDFMVSPENADKDKIYKVATEQTINTLISEFKRRKIRHTMPSTLREKLRRKSVSSDKERSLSNSSISKEIEEQQKASVMRDGEAHLQVWKQLIQCVFDLHHSLSDKEFRAFIPMFFPGIECLVAYGTDNDLKLALADWLHRLVLCCGFSMNSNLVSSEG